MPLAQVQGFATNNSLVPLASSYKYFSWGFTASFISLINDGLSDTISWSWDGTDLAGVLKPGEKVEISNVQTYTIWIKGQNGGEAYRLTVTQ